MKEINVSSSITPEPCIFIVNQAIKSGSIRSSLRWRVSEAQAAMIHKFLFNVADNHTLRYEAEHGTQETGMFAGVPFFVDTSLSMGEMILEAVVTTEPVARITGLPVPLFYSE